MRLLIALLLLAGPAGARAQASQTPPIIVSAAPDHVDVTFYRDSQRNPDAFITFDPDDEDATLGGYAMITETRTVDLPSGEVVVRFEGVASGIIPQSAILFDQDLAEKNFDSRLLSKRGLIDAFTGQRVTVRRTDPKTGGFTEEPGTIRSNPDQLILHTRHGYEAIQCGGSLDSLIFPHVPVDLTARPTLSLTTRADQKGGRLMLTLAYLAANFDWQANYVGTFAADGQSLRLLGWMTLASRDRTSFVDSAANVVAGMLARAGKTEDEQDAEDEERDDDPYGVDNIAVVGQCWPSARTSPSGSRTQLFAPGTLPTLTAPVALRLDEGFCCFSVSDEDAGDIVVTAARRAERADLGDLKLYTITRPTTIAAQSMKQVRFLEERVVKGETLYRIRHRGSDLNDIELIFRFDNKRATGGGEPLPTGQVSLFQQGTRGRQLVGETFILDKAVDEEVEFALPDAEGYNVDVDTDEIDSGDDWERRKLTVTNDNDFPIVFETEFQNDDDYRVDRFSARTFRRKGRTVWHTTVDPKGKRSIEFRVTERPDEREQVRRGGHGGIRLSHSISPDRVDLAVNDD